MCMHASPCLSMACCAFSVTSCSAGIQDSLWLPRSRLQRRQRPVTQVQGFELARLTGWQSTLYAVRKESRNGLMEGCRDLSRSADPWIQAIMTSCKWMPIMSITLRSLESRRPYSRQESRCCILVRRVNTTSQLECLTQNMRISHIMLIEQNCIRSYPQWQLACLFLLHVEHFTQASATFLKFVADSSSAFRSVATWNLWPKVLFLHLFAPSHLSVIIIIACTLLTAL